MVLDSLSIYNLIGLAGLYSDMLRVLEKLSIPHAILSLSAHPRTCDKRYCYYEFLRKNTAKVAACASPG